jgi:DNA-binding MarR family transcriptional regulator
VNGHPDFPDDVWALANAATLQHSMFTTEALQFAVATVAAHALMADRFQRINLVGLTTKQAACLKAIADHQASTGLSPSFDELAVALGLASKSGVQRLLMALEKRGRILRPANRSRAITIIANPAN